MEFKFGALWFFKGKTIYIEKIRILDKDECGVLAELVIPNEKPLYAAFFKEKPTYFMHIGAAIYLGDDFHLPFDHVVIWKSRKIAEKAFNRVKNDEVCIYHYETKHFKNRDLQWLAKEFQFGLPRRDPVFEVIKAMEEALKTDSEESKIFIEGLGKYFREAVKHYMKIGEKLYRIETFDPLYEKKRVATVFASDLSTALREANRQILLKVSELDEYLREKPASEREIIEAIKNMYEMELKLIKKYSDLYSKLQQYYRELAEKTKKELNLRLDDEYAFWLTVLRDEGFEIRSKYDIAKFRDKVDKIFNEIRGEVGEKVALMSEWDSWDAGGVFYVVELLSLRKEKTSEDEPLKERYIAKILRENGTVEEVRLGGVTLAKLPQKLKQLPLGRYRKFWHDKTEVIEGNNISAIYRNGCWEIKHQPLQTTR
ncbi:MAG: hypothetical protein B6U95_00235 [Thermofilum sp. ex4484_82]|nr:MAG: hypothetical protein B6U95_00235 [Thermofilum sp. ex4484_82]OYT40158.1 MAG: hypothetical protein B6U96_00235 [Archaeoglobales archaeon ex4484_92]